MNTPQRIHLRRIKAGSLFKLVFVATATVFVPAILFLGVLALCGANTVVISGRYVTGVKGLLAAVLLTPLFTVLFSLFAWFVVYMGIRSWGHFRAIRLDYVPAEEGTDQPPRR